MVLCALVLFAGVVGCSRDNAAGPVTILVSDKVIPVGKMAAAAWDDGSIASTTVPADVAPGDGVHELSEIRCLVPSQTIPQGTLLRRSMFVEPSVFGLPKGLTEATAKLTSCG